MSGYGVSYTTGAEDEITEAYLWIKERMPKAAEKWREELICQIESLGENPLRHPLAPESGSFAQEIRLMLFRKRRSQFRIYYTVIQKQVVILTVRRSARKPLEESDIEI